MTKQEQPWLDTDRRPDGVTDATVEAVGKVSEAMEWIERSREQQRPTIDLDDDLND